jgi:hypothetical protein
MRVSPDLLSDCTREGGIPEPLSPKPQALTLYPKPCPVNHQP